MKMSILIIVATELQIPENIVSEIINVVTEEVSFEDNGQLCSLILGIESALWFQAKAITTEEIGIHLGNFGWGFHFLCQYLLKINVFKRVEMSSIGTSPTGNPHCPRSGRILIANPLLQENAFFTIFLLKFYGTFCKQTYT